MLTLFFCVAESGYRNTHRKKGLLIFVDGRGKALDKLESSGGRTLKGERFVTDEELSRLLKISRRTLQEYRTARIIPYYLIQGKVLYMESEIQKFLEDSRKKCIGGQEWV